MNYPIRVLHVFNCFEQGGIENFVMNVYRNIDRNKIQFDFAFLRSKKGCFDDEVRTLGGNIYYFDSETVSFKNYKKSLTRLLNEYGPFAAIHCHIYFFSGYVLKIAKKNNVPIRIAHSHETQKGRKQTLIRKMYESYMRKMIIKYATIRLACSNEAGKHLFQNVFFTTIYNGVDIERFRFSENKRIATRLNLGIENKTVFLNVGRFSDQKNHAFLIDVFSKYLEKNKAAVLLLVGSGERFEQIKKTIETKGISDNVFLLGDRKNTEDYYCASDVFLMPSKYEGLGIVAVESQINGLVSILSSNITREVCLTDLISFIEIDDPEKWCEMMISIENKKITREQYSDLMRNTIFDIKQTVAVLESVYLGQFNE